MKIRCLLDNYESNGRRDGSSKEHRCFSRVRISLPSTLLSIRSRINSMIEKGGMANQWMGHNSDAFTKREKANEDYTIRQREKEKLAELRKKIAEQQEHLKKLENHM